MATLVSELIEDTNRHLYGSSRQEINRLKTTVGTTDVTIELEFDLLGAVRGSYISIEDEIMYVFSATSASKQLVVARGYLGTAAAAHTAAAIVEVNPRFPREFIKEALKREINSYGPRLFRVTAHNISTLTDGLSYDMPVSDFYHVVGITGKYTDSSARPALFSFNIEREMDTADFSSGSALLLNSALTLGSTLRLRIARPFDTSTFLDGTDVEATVGLAYSMVDIPSIGAAYRLLSTREIPRTNMAAQPEPRRAEEVPPGHISSVVQQLKRMRDERISEEQFTLREKYPYRIG
jgi:hypothetical protein